MRDSRKWCSWSLDTSVSKPLLVQHISHVLAIPTKQKSVFVNISKAFTSTYLPMSWWSSTVMWSMGGNTWDSRFALLLNIQVGIWPVLAFSLTSPISLLVFWTLKSNSFHLPISNVTYWIGWVLYLVKVLEIKISNLNQLFQNIYKLIFLSEDLFALRHLA